MTILHIASSVGGGAGAGMFRYHQALLAAGVDSKILVSNRSANAHSRIEVCSRRLPSIFHRIARRLGTELDPAERILQQVRQLDAKSGERPNYELFSPPFSRCTPEEHPWVREADVVNLHWVAGTIDWPRFFRKVTKPMIITLHDQQPYLGGFHYARDLENNPWLRELDTRVRAIKQSLLRGHRIAVIGNSEWNTREAQASGFFPEGTRFQTVYYPLNTKVYAPRPKDAARATFGIEPGKTVIGFACEELNNPRKGFAVLLDALGRLTASLAAQCCLLSFGRAPAQTTKDRVPMPWLHLGHLDSDVVKVAAYSAMDTFVAPSLAEAFGQTAIEALACGTAVIGSRTGGLAEALFDGEGGVLVEPRNPAALLEALTSLLEHLERRDRLATAGRRLVAERHAPGRVGKQWLQICQSLCA